VGGDKDAEAASQFFTEVVDLLTPLGMRGVVEYTVLLEMRDVVDADCISEGELVMTVDVVGCWLIPGCSYNIYHIHRACVCAYAAHHQESWYVLCLRLLCAVKVTRCMFSLLMLNRIGHVAHSKANRNR
jgi:hypothetical protein